MRFDRSGRRESTTLLPSRQTPGNAGCALPRAAGPVEGRHTVVTARDRIRRAATRFAGSCDEGHSLIFASAVTIRIAREYPGRDVDEFSTTTPASTPSADPTYRRTGMLMKSKGFTTRRTARTHSGRGGGSSAEQSIRLAPFAFGGTSGTTIPARHRRHDLGSGWRRTLIDQALCGDRRAHTFGDDLLDYDDAVEPVDPGTHLIAGFDLMSRLDRDAVHLDVPAATRGRGGRPGFEQPDSPGPGVDPGCTRLRRGQFRFKSGTGREDQAPRSAVTIECGSRCA